MEIFEKLKIVESFLGEPHKVGNEYLYHCPLCDHTKKKLSLNFSKGKYKCWVCDSYGNIRKLISRRASNEMFSKWKLLDGEIDINTDLDTLFSESKTGAVEDVISLPNTFLSLTGKKKTPKTLDPLKYLKKREITNEDILYWKIGFCYDDEYKDRVIFPSFNMNGDLNFFVGRALNDSNFAKYKNAEASKNIIFNELYLDFDQDLVVTEGVIDAIKAGHNSVPLLGSTMREESKLFQKIVRYDTTVYMALDPDAIKKESEIIKKLMKYDIDVYKVDIHPYKDVGKMSKEEFKKRKQEAKLMTNDKLLELELEAI